MGLGGMKVLRWIRRRWHNLWLWLRRARLRVVCFFTWHMDATVASFRLDGRVTVQRHDVHGNVRIDPNSHAWYRVTAACQRCERVHDYTVLQREARR